MINIRYGCEKESPGVHWQPEVRTRDVPPKTYPDKGDRVRQLYRELNLEQLDLRRHCELKKMPKSRWELTDSIQRTQIQVRAGVINVHILVIRAE